MSTASKVVRLILFCVFFGAGAAALAFSILINEIHEYYQSTITVENIERTNARLKQLEQESAAQIQLILDDPNVLENLKYVTFGSSVDPEKSAAPQPSDELSNQRLEEYIQAVLARHFSHNHKKTVPRWVLRSRRKNARISLFLAGMGLVFVSIIFFGKA